MLELIISLGVVLSQVWSIFAPKFVFDAVTLLALDFVLFISTLLSLYMYFQAKWRLEAMKEE